ncbi:hypothetical protein [Kushneria phyllosphaerae]|uniref:Uncharacterized protein n=1 Tax=Kushneria phyllosphaerae TaxID=2100822 RepID=A0A2R8CHJ4_9GAMM|nr:hypothetical protein [Kushneria phyllosphaerae]SPJ32375.1 hypothetical protein KSP9073_00375 [Kushneria phyllosphaerae]
MDTYFIRHSSNLDVDVQTLEDLWNSDKIAIHYPHDLSNTFEKEDSSSLDPDDYEAHGKYALRRLHSLAKTGGYVFATYRGKNGGKIGYVPPGSEVDIFQGTWGNKNNLSGRKAVLKSLTLKKVRNLVAEEAISLTSVQPRQGTFCQWRKVGSRVVAMTEGMSSMEMGALTPDLQEVMCMEYLRTPKARQHGLPNLVNTLMPVGRTMKDIDILGAADSGEIISAQVTYKNFYSSDSKFKKLDPYALQGNKTIYFCQCDAMQVENGHIVFPLGIVFKEFCLESEAGKNWFFLATGSIQKII